MNDTGTRAHTDQSQAPLPPMNRGLTEQLLMYFLIMLVFQGMDEAGGDHLSTSVDSLNNEILKWLMNF